MLFFSFRRTGGPGGCENFCWFRARLFHPLPSKDSILRYSRYQLYSTDTEISPYVALCVNVLVRGAPHPSSWYAKQFGFLSLRPEEMVFFLWPFFVPSVQIEAWGWIYGWMTEEVTFSSERGFFIYHDGVRLKCLMGWKLLSQGENEEFSMSGAWLPLLCAARRLFNWVQLQRSDFRFLSSSKAALYHWLWGFKKWSTFHRIWLQVN